MSKNSGLSWALLISLSIIWGSSFVLMHEGLKVFSSSQLAAYRLSIAGLIFLPFALINLKKIERKDIKWFVLAGLLGNFIPAFCFAHAQTYILSSTAGALNSLTPFFTLLAGVLLFSKSFNKYKIIGMLFGLSGALILVLNKPGGGIESHLEYGGLIILATLLYGINVNVIENKLSKYSHLIISTTPLSLIFIPSILCLIFFDFPITNMLSEHYIKGSILIAILGIVGTGLGLILFNRLIQLTNGLFASTVTYMMPVVSTVWGVYYNEPIGLIQISSICLILLGILIVRKFNY